MALIWGQANGGISHTSFPMGLSGLSSLVRRWWCKISTAMTHCLHAALGCYIFVHTSHSSWWNILLTQCETPHSPKLNIEMKIYLFASFIYLTLTEFTELFHLVYLSCFTYEKRYFWLYTLKLSISTCQSNCTFTQRAAKAVKLLKTIKKNICTRYAFAHANPNTSELAELQYLSLFSCSSCQDFEAFISLVALSNV